MDQFRLDFTPAPHSLPRKKHEKAPFIAPPCDACKAVGREKRDNQCRACKLVYMRLYKAARPDVANAAFRRNDERRKEARPDIPKKPRRSFKQRYRTDPEFREARKAKQRAWAAANPDKIAAKRERDRDVQGARRRKHYKALVHDPLVYFIRSHLAPVIKIGWTTWLAGRISGLRTGHPGRLEILATMPGGAAAEAEVHALFAAQRYDGEWFLDTPALADYIKQHATAHVPDIGGVSLEPGHGWTAERKAKRRTEPQATEGGSRRAG